jgi:hypothetical protein
MPELIGGQTIPTISRTTAFGFGCLSSDRPVQRLLLICQPEIIGSSQCGHPCPATHRVGVLPEGPAELTWALPPALDADRCDQFAQRHRWPRISLAGLELRF